MMLLVCTTLIDHTAINRDAHYPASLLRHTTSWGRALGGSSVGRGRHFFVRRASPCLLSIIIHRGRAPGATCHSDKPAGEQVGEPGIR